ncbi:hypothetical protein [Arthrobacter sp. PAMC 25486]|uniref:hypothetical protein n=1 Tax=Arthrobacter sp. PAMC 25486 TaxID=1494608 RepID=UPI0012FF0E5E|nr:hypothetical protein [Arthrobacter sp. PAMC 25486]
MDTLEQAFLAGRESAARTLVAEASEYEAQFGEMNRTAAVLKFGAQFIRDERVTPALER